MFHISDIKKYSRCPKMYWNSLYLESEPRVQFLRMDEEIMDLVLRYLHIDEYFLGQKGDENAKAMEALKHYSWLVKARFELAELRIKIPLMHKVEDKWDIYFILIGLYAKEDDLQYYCNNIWVLERLGIKIGKIRLIHLNKNYVRQDDLKLDELFVCAEDFTNPKGVPLVNITSEVKSHLTNLYPIMEEMKKIAEIKEYPAEKNKACIRKVRCGYYQQCFSEEENLEDDSILTLVSSQYKNKMYQDGIRLLKDAPIELIEGTRQQYAQIMASKNGGLFMDKTALKNWLKNSLIYPLCYLDFEWETFAIPPYSALKPFDVVPFEYSLHIEQADGSIVHKEYVGIKDCRKELIEHLLCDLPSCGSIVAYNGEGAEKIRLLELAEQFPQYQEELKQMAERIVDLSVPFINGLIYDIGMRGFYSLKVLLKVFTEQSYSDLAISHGMDAVYQWRMLDKEGKNEKEIANELMEYCGMDTYAMLLLVRWLKKNVEEEINENF